jgi:D-amino peptidase
MTGVFISIDMEGVAGVATLRQVWRGSDDFPAARMLMTREVNAAVDGSF